MSKRGAATSLFEVSVINQAMGALIGQGYTPEQAERHLTAESAKPGSSRYAVSLRILAGLTARSPLLRVASSGLGTQLVRDESAIYR